MVAIKNGEGDARENFTKAITALNLEINTAGLRYEIGKKHNFENLRDFFKLIYKVLLGQEQGPRLGSFIKLYGIKKTIKLIDDILKND